MNSIERRFKLIEKEHPYWAAYTCLAEAISGRNYNHKTIRRNFLNLVPKEDYDEDIEKDLIAELDRLSNTPMNVRNQG